jgi:hypothetical protein
MELLTNGSILAEAAPHSTTVIRRASSGEEQQTDEKNSEVGATKLQWEWKLERVQPIRQQTSPPRIVETAIVPDCVHSFVKSVAKIPTVKCVIVEDGEAGTVHITTFVENPNEEIRNKIYAVEAETIQANPNLVFDFHTRRAEEVSGNPASIAGKHYYAIWCELDAERT